MSETNQQKPDSTNVGGAPPQWATPGTEQYGNVNTQLQTLPMAAATQTIGQGGMGPVSQNMAGNPGQIDQSMFQDIYGQSGNIGSVGTGNFQDVYGQAGQSGAAENYLTETAQGDYLSGSPQLDDIISRGAQDIGDQTSQMFASGGRYGSGAHQGTVADSVADYANQLRHQDYQAERGHQMGAAQAIESAQQGRMGQQLGAARGVAGAEGQNIANQLQGMNVGLGAAQGATGVQGQNIANQFNAADLENQGFMNMLGMIQALPGIQANKVFDAEQQMGIGQALDQQAQQQLQDDIGQWRQLDNEGWARLGGLISGAQGAAGPYGTQTSETESSGGLGDILGGIGGLLSGFGAL